MRRCQASTVASVNARRLCNSVAPVTASSPFSPAALQGLLLFPQIPMRSLRNMDHWRHSNEIEEPQVYNWLWKAPTANRGMTTVEELYHPQPRRRALSPYFAPSTAGLGSKGCTGGGWKPTGPVAPTRPRTASGTSPPWTRSNDGTCKAGGSEVPDVSGASLGLGNPLQSPLMHL